MGKPSKIRMAKDATGQRTTYEEIEVGKDLGSFEWVVTQGDIERDAPREGVGIDGGRKPERI